MRKWYAVLASASLLWAATATVISGATLQAQVPFPPASTAASGPQGIMAVGPQGSAALAPDEAVMSATVETDEASGTDALNTNAQTVQSAMAALEALGVVDADIQTTQLSLSPVYPPQYPLPYPPLPGGAGPTLAAPQAVPTPPAVSYYRASENITVTTTDLNGVPDMVEAMVNAGATSFGGVQFTWQNPEQLRTMAVQAASADAQAQAQTLAGSLGVTLGDVLSSSVNYSSAPPVPCAYPTRVPTAAPPPPLPGGFSVSAPIIQSGLQSATASVTVTYAIAGH